jgi:arsenite methyltransferase
MRSEEKEIIRQAVQDRYGQIANMQSTEANSVSTPGTGKTCCNVLREVSDKEKKTSTCCDHSHDTWEQMAHAIGYSADDTGGILEGANLGLGCGNPVAMASLKPGEMVVDLGSGGGFDCFLASKQVGESGRVIGVDMTPEMIAKARKNAQKMDTGNVDFRLGEIEHLPIAANSTDIIMSNCVINLSPDKKRVFQEAFRILKQGGRLAISDIVATQELPKALRKNLDLVAACIGGAATVEDITNILFEVGFRQIKISPKEESRDVIQNWLPDNKATGSIFSAYIEAVKPIVGRRV